MRKQATIPILMGVNSKKTNHPIIIMNHPVNRINKPCVNMPCVNMPGVNMPGTIPNIIKTPIVITTPTIITNKN